MNNKPKTIFWGTSEFAVPALKKLCAIGYKPLAIYTAPDKPVGRKQVLTHPPVKIAAQTLGAPVLQPATLKSDEQFEQFQQLEPDLCITVAYGKIIPEKWLAVPRFGFLNIHPSLLPRHRGPTPIQTAILNGDKETGVTIMKLDKEVDRGPLLANSKFQIPNSKQYQEIERELSMLGTELLVKTLPKYLAGEIKPQEQDHSQATFTKKFTREDGKIDWKRPAEKIHNQIRALNPEPGTWTKWNSQLLSILESELTENIKDSEPVGKIRNINNKIAAKTGRGYLEIKKVQLEGKKPMEIGNFIRGQKDFMDSTLF